MASIPLPALGVRAPNPIEDYKNMMSLDSLSNAQDLQKAQLQGEQQQIQMRDQAMRDQAALKRAYMESDGDLEKTSKLASKYGASPTAIVGLNDSILKQKEAYNKLDESAAKLRKENNAALTPSLSAALEADPEDRPAMWTLAMNKAIRNKQIDPKEAQQYMQYPGDEGARMFVNAHKTEEQLLAARTAEPKTRKESVEADQKQLGLVAQTLGGAASQQDWDSRLAFLKERKVPDSMLAVIPKEYTPEAAKRAKQLGTTTDKQVPVSQQELESFMAAPPKGYQATPQEFNRWNKEHSQIVGFNLGQKAAESLAGPSLEAAATDYLTSNKYPPGVRGPSGVAMQNKIREKAMSMIPEGMNLAQVRAAYAGDKNSLASLKKQTDQVEAFEATANKNLDQAVQAAQQITSTDARFANVPIRMLARMVGTSANARLVTAVNTARSEIAKVLSSANASGGAVSDSMRHEVNALLDENLSLSAFMTQAAQLRTDMENRKTSYREQLNDINGRLGAATGGGAPAAPGSKAPPVIVTLPSGQKITIE